MNIKTLFFNLIAGLFALSLVACSDDAGHGHSHSPDQGHSHGSTTDQQATSNPDSTIHDNIDSQ